MNTEFIWTDETVLEFVQFTLKNSPLLQGRYTDIEQFKESKQPKPEWVILKVKGINSNILTDFNTEYYNNENWNIYSVKRLSDGEVFAIGDKICYLDSNSQYDVIKTIKLGHYQFGGLSSPAPYFSVEKSSFGCYIDKIKKYKEPIFETEDGNHISIGDDYWYVTRIYSIYPDKCNSMTGAKIIANGRAGDKYFSSEEAAKEWVLFNKPLLSLNEIKNIGQIDPENIYFKRFINAANNKLNK